MDMEMDIPLPDELESLEAFSHLHEDYIDTELPETLLEEEVVEEEDELPQPTVPKPQILIPPKTSYSGSVSSAVSPSVPESTIDGHKRLRSDDPDALLHSIHDNVVVFEEKRSRIEEPGPDGDEDWLRYSPLRDSEHMVEEQVDLEAEEKTIFRYVSEIDGDFIPVTAPSGGGRVYAKLHRVETEEQMKKLDQKTQARGLIPHPINSLLLRVEQEAFTKTLKASSEGHIDVVLPETKVVHEQLWVDKYAPNSFTELLSDEQTNREVLLWLKQWDSCVFGSEIRSTSDEVLSSLRRHSSIAQHHKLSNSSFHRKNRGPRWSDDRFQHSSNLDDEDGNSKRNKDFGSNNSRVTGPPEQKILLLCGSPGLGKTTLAHVAARHCGYRVIEVNASDDRSSSAIESKILDAVEMNSVMVDARPKCLVIDEIDGALGDGKGAVDVILKMVSAEKKSDMWRENVTKEEKSGRISSKKGRKSVSLSRPVVCICNDLYAPALRSLRQVAKVHVFVQPTVGRIVSRLKYICNKEGMKTSSVALSALAEYTECDIRSCLNTLQFLNKKKEALNAMEISSQVVGRKDMSKSVFDIWKEIFYKRKRKQQRRSDYLSGSVYNEFDILHSLVSNRGDYDLILDGIHENILELHYHDPVMQKTVKCVESLGSSDLIHQYIMRTQQMALLVYQPFSAVVVHRLVAQVQKPNIGWPKSYQRYRTTLLEKMDVLRSWHHKIPPHISRHMSMKSLIEDSVSPLIHILSPPTLRPVAMHLLSEKEKDILSQLVSTMVSYGISYKNKNTKSDPLPNNNLRHEANFDGSMLAFDPPLDDFVNFKGYEAGYHILALAMKQVLVHEVEKQKILQVTTARSAHLPGGNGKENQEILRTETLNGVPATADPRALCARYNVGNSKDLVNPGQHNPSVSKNSSNLAPNKTTSTGVVKKSSVGSSCFFDRFRKLSDKGPQDAGNADRKEITMERDIRPLLFKFNEGFTNAIKRPARVRDFLL